MVHMRCSAHPVVAVVHRQPSLQSLRQQPRPPSPPSCQPPQPPQPQARGRRRCGSSARLGRDTAVSYIAGPFYIILCHVGIGENDDKSDKTMIEPWLVEIGNPKQLKRVLKRSHGSWCPKDDDIVKSGLGTTPGGCNA